MHLRDSDIQRRFDHAAARFDEFDFVHAVTRQGLLDRLGPMLIEPQHILDLGCATGSGCALLARTFRKATVTGVDQSAAMLQQAAGKQGWRRKFRLLEANAAALPLPAESVDLVFCNQLLPWVNEVDAVLVEINRVLRTGGLFMFASLGPDSLAELRAAWASCDDQPHVHDFADMHNIGDAAVRAGLSDPVLDVDRLLVTYRDPAALFADLTGSGARNCRVDRRSGLTGRTRFAQMRNTLKNTAETGPIRLQLELVYGHCWGSGPRPRQGEVHIRADNIGRRR